MSTYQITVNKSGKHLFTTERQPVGCDFKGREFAVEEIGRAFSKKEGYEALLITWPDELGSIYPIPN